MFLSVEHARPLTGVSGVQDVAEAYCFRFT